MTNHQATSSFPPITQDIIRAYAAILAGRGFEPAPAERNQSIRQQLIQAGLDGDLASTAASPRWQPNAFSESTVDRFLASELKNARYAIFSEILAVSAAEINEAFNDGAIEIVKNLEGDIDRRLMEMGSAVVDILSPWTRGRNLVAWLATTDWGGEPARAALRDFHQVELNAHRSAFRIMEAGHAREMRSEPGAWITPEMFAALASALTWGQILTEKSQPGGSIPDRQPLAIGVTALLSWTLRRNRTDPGLLDFLDYLQGGRPAICWGHSPKGGNTPSASDD